MAVLDAYRGPHQFGPAYAAMFAQDVHAEGSADRRVTERMVLLCAATAPLLYRQPAAPQPGARPVLEQHLAGVLGGATDGEDRVEAIARACAAMVEAVDADPSRTLDDLRFGGTEEEILDRGSNWCTDVARLACTLCQLAGVPARIVSLADTQAAYSGHQIIEAWRSGLWGAVDPTTGVVYTDEDGRPATTWELICRPELIRRHRRGDATLYTNPAQFRAAAISEYPTADPGHYAVTAINPYCRSILEMADRGWPGGLRWLHGEDRLPPR